MTKSVLYKHKTDFFFDFCLDEQLDQSQPFISKLTHAITPVKERERIFSWEISCEWIK